MAITKRWLCGELSATAHRVRVAKAMRDFMSKKSKRRDRRKAQKQKAKQGKLWQ